MPAIKSYGTKIGFLSASTLKLIACIAMFLDHLGYVIFPKVMIFRVIGRLAFPIFAYFVAEGCRYTRNRLRHFLVIFTIGVIYFAFYLFAFKQMYPSIFLTFSFSILNICIIDELKKYAFGASETNGENSVLACPRVKILRVVFAFSLAALALGISYIPFYFVIFDYGYIGMLAPVLVSLFDFKDIKVPEKINFLDSYPVRLTFIALICIALTIKNPVLRVELFGISVPVQTFNLCAIPILLLYNGRVGAKKLKYFFYAFYPLHLGIIMLVYMLIKTM